MLHLAKISKILGGGGVGNPPSSRALLLLVAALLVAVATLALGERTSADEGDLDTGYWETITDTVTEPATAPLTATAVSVGWDFAIALRTDGTLRAWGFGDDGQLDLPETYVWRGNSSDRDSNRSLVETSPTRYAQVDAGGAHACALTTEGELECWGDNSSGQATVPMRLLSDDPDTRIPSPGYAKVSAGGSHTCALTNGDDIICWGSNSYGQSVVPASTAAGGGFKDVDAGNRHTCAINADDAIQCWGDNADGKTNAPRDGSYSSITTGSENHSCAINAEGASVCWGSNVRGQEYPPAGEYSQISGGSWHACAIWSDDDLPLRGAPDVLGHQSPPGNIDCWGANDYGQASPPNYVLSQLSAGSRSSCGIENRTDRVRCWGEGPVINVPSVGTMVERSVQRRQWVDCFNGANVPTQGTLGAFTRSDGTTQFAFKPYRIDQVVPVFSFAPDEGALTVGSWYFSSPISFTVTEQPKALKECRDRFEPRETTVDVGRVGVRLLATGHLDLILRTADGDIAVPQNHNRIPNPAEPGKWWITDRVTFR